MHTIRALAVPLVFFILDRTLKTFALFALPLWEGSFFVLHRNQGVAFSIALPSILMVIGIAAALVTVSVAAFREYQKETPYLFPYFFIITGALSNIFDRIRYGAVIDYFTVPHIGLFFNLADVMILMGILLLVIRRSGTIS